MTTTSTRLTVDEHRTRDLLILDGVSHGKTTAEISESLGWNAEGVKGRIKAMLRQHGAKDRAELILIALRKGLIT